MSEITKVETKPLAVQPSEVEGLIRIALDKGLNPTELYAILREERQTRAKAEFTKAIAAFQRDCPVIPKNHKAGGVTKSGARFEYFYANMPEIRAVIQPYLDRHGLVISFTSRPPTIPNTYTAVCVVRHIGGYEDAVPITGPIDQGHMANVQQIGSTQTYYERYALKSALGLDVGGLDTDGDKPLAENTPITDGQACTLNDLIVEVGDARGKPIDRAAFLKIFKAEKLSDIPASRYDEATAKLEAQRAKVAK